MNITQLTNSQKQQIKTHVQNNANTVETPQGTVQIKDVLVSADTYTEVAQWYNAQATPPYWVWKSSVTRADVYHKVGPDGTVWNWSTFKSQQLPEQNTWTQMFMGDTSPCHLITFREGAFNVFSGSTPQNNQRAHVLSIFRRQAIRLETVIAAAVTAAGVGGSQIVPDADNGNVLTDTLGGTTNPAVLPFTASGVYVEGSLTPTDLAAIVSGTWV